MIICEGWSYFLAIGVSVRSCHTANFLLTELTRTTQSPFNHPPTTVRARRRLASRRCVRRASGLGFSSVLCGVRERRVLWTRASSDGMALVAILLAATCAAAAYQGERILKSNNYCEIQNLYTNLCLHAFGSQNKLHSLSGTYELQKFQLWEEISFTCFNFLSFCWCFRYFNTCAAFHLSILCMETQSSIFCFFGNTINPQRRKYFWNVY